MATSNKPLKPSAVALTTSPVIHNVYSPTTDTWQYIVADSTTLHCIVLDAVRDRCADPAAMSTSAADAIIAVIKERDYIVDYILETHGASRHCRSASWYLRMQLSVLQGHPPQLCNEATVSGLEVMWQRKYGAGSAFSTTIRAGLTDGETVKFGQLSLTCLHMPGFGTPYRRAYLVCNDLFGAHSVATLKEDTGETDFYSAAANATNDAPEESPHHRDAWDSLQRVLSLPTNTRIWREQGDGSPVTEDQPFDSLAQCVMLNKHAKSSESEFLTDMRVKSTLRGLAQSDGNANGGWKCRVGNWLYS